MLRINAVSHIFHLMSTFLLVKSILPKIRTSVATTTCGQPLLLSIRRPGVVKRSKGDAHKWKRVLESERGPKQQEQASVLNA